MPDISRSIFFKKVITFRCNDDVFGTLCIFFLKKSSNSSPADVSLSLLYDCLLIYWFWFVLGWNNRTADGERARQLEAPHVSEQQSHSEPGSLHLQLLDVMRAKFDVRDGNYIQKWQQNGTFHVCYQVAPSANVIMTGRGTRRLQHKCCSRVSSHPPVRCY